jgi:DnaJ-class molecular chaperone
LALKYHPDHSKDPDACEEMFLEISRAYETLIDPEKRNVYNKDRGYGHFDNVEMQSGTPEPTIDTSETERSTNKVIVGEERISTADIYSKVEDLEDADGIKIAQRAAYALEEEEEFDQEEEDKEQEPEEEIAAWGEKVEAEPEEGKKKRSFFKVGKKVGAIFGAGGAQDKRKQLKEGLKTRLADEPERGTYVKPKKPLRPLSSAELKEKEVLQREQSSSQFRGERVFIFQISKLESIVGTTRQLALAGRDGEPRINDVQIPGGVADGQMMEVSWGWERAKIHVQIVRNPLLDVVGRNILIRLPVTIEEALEGAELTIPTLNGPSRISLRPKVNPLHGMVIEGKGLQIDPTFPPGDIIVSPRIVPPRQSSATLVAASQALEAVYDFDVRAEVFLQDSLYYTEDGLDLVLELPITFGEALNGFELDLPTEAGGVKLKVAGPWAPDKNIRFEGQGTKKLDGSCGDLWVFPFVVMPKTIDSGVMAAAKAISQHHMSPVRKNLPKKIEGV